MAVSHIHKPTRAGLADLSPTYREFPPPPALEDILECLWIREQPEPPGYSRVVPDACIDVIWMGSDQLLVAGSATRPIIAEAPSDSGIVGIRFRTGLAPAILGVAADALLDLHVPLDTIWPRESREILEKGASFEDAPTRLRVLQDTLDARLRRGSVPDGLVTAGVALLQANNGLNVRDLGDRLGSSERQLRRRFRAAVGYGPKTLARILRFQSALHLLPEYGKRHSLADIAQHASYTDQAHMTHEFVQLAGATPAALAMSSREKSDSYNTELHSRP